MSSVVRKLVLPVAGIGKRLRPLTLRTPKNLIKVGGRPLIAYALEEALQSGIREVVLVINPRDKERFRKFVRLAKQEFTPLKFHIRVQEKPGGNGHALIPAADVVGDDPFAVRFCDDILVDKTPVLKSLMNLFGFYHAPVILLERVPRHTVSRWGVVGVRKPKMFRSETRGKAHEITQIIEKPSPKVAPSNLAVVGGYVLTPRVLRGIKKVAESLPLIAPDALPINVGLQIELMLGGQLYGLEFAGKRLDCGTIEALEKTERFLRRA